MKVEKMITKYKLTLKRKLIRGFRYVVFKNEYSKIVRKYARMDALRAVSLFASSCYSQVKMRPRIKLVSFATLGLIIAFFASNQISAYIKSKEADIKVNGHAVLVADKATEAVEQPEIEADIKYKRSPFDFRYPVSGQISQGFTRYHRALDIAAPYNWPLKPLGAGKVEFAGTVADGKGHIVVIDHGDGLKTSYAHMNRITVGINDEVTTETEIGTIGLTGRTTGPHVHLEVFDRGIAINPGDVLPDR